MSHMHFLQGGSVTPACVQALTARNLSLLLDTEATLVALEADTRLFDALTASFEELGARLQAAPSESAIDPAGQINNALLQAEESARRSYERALEQRQAAQDEAVIRAYDTLTASHRRTFEAIETLREWVETHDAILEPPLEGVFSTTSELFAAMGMAR